MGIYDRDYYRAGPARRLPARLPAWSVTTWLIGINVALFVVDRVLAPARSVGPLIRGGDLSVAGLAGLQVWRVVTFQFLHADLGPLVFGQVAIFFFAPIVEDLFRGRRFLVFYLLCGLGGGVAHVVLSTVGLFGDTTATPLIGSAGGVLGVLVAAARFAPLAHEVRLFGVVPVTMRTAAWLGVGAGAYYLTDGFNHLGANVAHLVGAGIGLLLVEQPALLNWAAKGRRR